MASLTIRELLTKYSFKADDKPIKQIDRAVEGFKASLASMDARIKSAFASLAKVTAIGAAAASAAIIKLGSDAEESEAKFKAVFGDQEDTVREWSEVVAKSMGRSTFKMREFAAGLQDTFVPLGFARDVAAQMSMNLVELSEDVASFQNKASPEVMADFQSALVGNHETVRKYGIIITQARLDKKISALKKEMPGFIRLSKEQQQVLARQKLIFEGTSDAQGDAHRTAGSFANQMKRLRALVEDTARKLGEKLLPTLTAWVKRAGDWISQNEDLIRQKVGAALEAIVSAFKKLGAMLSWVVDNWKILATVATALVGGRILFGLIRITKQFGAMATAVGQVTAGAGGISGKIGAAAGGAGKLAGALGKAGQIGAALGVGWTIGKVLDDAFGLSDKLSSALFKLDRALQDKFTKARVERHDRETRVARLRETAERFAALRQRGVQSIQQRGGGRVQLDEAGIAQLLRSQAANLGITAEQQASMIPALIRQAQGLTGAQATQAPAAAPQQRNVNVAPATINVTVPPGTPATQAQRVAEAAGTATTGAMRRAIGDVAR